MFDMPTHDGHYLMNWPYQRLQVKMLFRNQESILETHYKNWILIGYEQLAANQTTSSMFFQ